ncbi:MAG: DEAD/DEAH box helicase, partial [Actinomycetota bacterium]
MSDAVPPLLDALPNRDVPADEALDAFSGYLDAAGIEPYPAQEEAIFEIALGNHVIVNTPTGSGKSLVATAAHFLALADGRRSIYTAPIKALVSEKFFALCREFGSEQVGMVTGDAAVNPDAPIICCTQEILANRALIDGRRADVDVAIIDEFHFYGDPQRGWAWQVPLLELPLTQFVLMSATLGNVEFFRRDLHARTDREVSLVRSATRPVPLDFEYRNSTTHRSVEQLLEAGKAPVYLVHFTQREATEAAQNYIALDPLTKDEKAAVKEALGGFRFDSPIGKDLR